MKFLVTFTLVDSYGYRRTALVLADSKGQANRVLYQSLGVEDLETLSKTEFQRMDCINDMLQRKCGPSVLGIL